MDPTADAMQMFINNIGERLESKKRELDEFNEKMKSLNETPQKSNRTPQLFCNKFYFTVIWQLINFISRQTAYDLISFICMWPNHMCTFHMHT